MKKTIALFVFAAVLIAGCPAPPPAPPAYGLVITEFTPSLTDVTACDKTITLTTSVENQGGFPIDTGNMKACLMGANFPGNTADQMWAINKTDTEICRNSTKKLAAATPGITGGTTSFKWKIFSPWLPHPMTRSDTFTSRIFYKYSSRAAASAIWIYTEDELAAARQRGEAIPSSLTVERTIAPVDIAIEVPQPVIASSTGDTFTVKVIVSNVGGGTVFDPAAITWDDSATVPSISEDSLNRVNITVSTPLDESGTGYCGDELSSIELRAGQSVTIPCDIKLHEGIGTKKSYPLLLTANYGYYIESTIAISVAGKKDQEATNCTKKTS